MHHSMYGAMLKMFAVIAVRSIIPLGAATIFLLSTQTKTVAQVSSQSGAGIGRTVIALCGLVFLLWAVWPWRQVWGRFPWAFIAFFLVAVGAGGLLMAVSPDYAASVFIAFMMLAGSYVVLAVEMALTRPRPFRQVLPGHPPAVAARTAAQRLLTGSDAACSVGASRSALTATAGSWARAVATTGYASYAISS